MADSSQQTLDDAVARNSAIVLSLPSAGMLRHHKSRFLAGDADGVWIESAPEDRILVDELIARQQPAAVSFKAGPLRASFVSCILRREPSYQINADTVVEALLLKTPEQVTTVQRRSDYRVRVPDDGSVSARMWRIAEKADLDRTPPANQEIKGRIRDVSLGGFAIVVPLEVKPAESPASPGATPASPVPAAGNAAPPAPPPAPEQQPEQKTEKIKLLMDERLRVEIRSEGEQPLLLEGRVRYLSPPARGNVRVGVQFTIENSIDGRQALAVMTRIVGNLQREEARRMRLGLVSDAA